MSRMFIQEVVSQHRNDFVAIMECEHCSDTHKLTSGYDDAFYHAKVIPAMACKSCKKNRSGAVIEPPTSENQHIAETLINENMHEVQAGKAACRVWEIRAKQGRT